MRQPQPLGHTLRGVCSIGIQEGQVWLMDSPPTIRHGRLALNHHREHFSSDQASVTSIPSILFAFHQMPVLHHYYVSIVTTLYPMLGDV